MGQGASLILNRGKIKEVRVQLSSFLRDSTRVKAVKRLCLAPGPRKGLFISLLSLSKFIHNFLKTLGRHFTKEISLKIRKY